MSVQTHAVNHRLLGLTDAQALEMLYYMKLAREFDQRTMKLYRQGKLHGLALTQIGQEAVAVGSAYALDKTKDVLLPLHRDLPAFLVHGQTVRRMMCTYMGKENGTTRGRDGNTHHGDPAKRIFGMISHLGVMVPVAAGVALASKMKGKDVVALNYLGEGGSNTGDFHEGINFAAVFKLPMVMIIENNQWAYSTPTKWEYACEKLADRAAGYGIPGEYVDGNDVLKMYEVCQKAVNRARRGDGPTLIEAMTFRRRGHAEHDDFFYVPKDMQAEWEAKDPIARFEAYLQGAGVYGEAQKTQLEARINKEMDDAIEFAEQSPLPDPKQVTEWVTHEPGCTCPSADLHYW